MARPLRIEYEGAIYHVTWEEITQSRRSRSRKACIYLIKKHTCATNRETAESFGTLSYSAVAKISGNVSKQLAVDKELREEIKRLQVNFSFFKLFLSLRKLCIVNGSGVHQRFFGP